MIFVEAKFDPFIDIEKILEGAAFEGAEIIEGNIRALMNEPKTGTPYRHVDGTVRNASAEGEAPGINSKDLVGSFDVIELSLLEAQIYSEIADLGYGAILEEKRSRQFTEPAIELSEPEIEKLVED